MALAPSGAAAVHPVNGHIFPARADIRQAAHFRPDFDSRPKKKKTSWVRVDVGAGLPASLPLMEIVE